MNHSMVVLSVSLVLSAGIVRAQEGAAPSFNPGNRLRLEQTEKSLVNALESASPGLQATAAQTVRELKSLLPEEQFSPFVIPLMRIVKDDDAQVEARILASLALHELHSGAGDFAIRREALFCGNVRLGHILAALAVERMKETELARESGKSERKSDIAGVR